MLILSWRSSGSWASDRSFSQEKGKSDGRRRKGKPAGQLAPKRVEIMPAQSSRDASLL